MREQGIRGRGGGGGKEPATTPHEHSNSRTTQSKAGDKGLPPSSEPGIRPQYRPTLLSHGCTVLRRSATPLCAWQPVSTYWHADHPWRPKQQQQQLANVCAHLGSRCADHRGWLD